MVGREPNTPEKSDIISDTGNDPRAPMLPMVYAGTSSARVNNEDSDYHISTVSQTITVPTTPCGQLQFYWAAILEDPQHPANEQPYVDIVVTDETTLYSKHFYSNDPSYPGWVVGSTNYWGEPWMTIPWQTVTVDVSSAAGHQIMIRVTAADCAQGGHGGYAYLDAPE